MNNKKKVLVTAVAVILIAILSFSTLAWFNAQDSIENKFQVATSGSADADDLFSVNVWEYNDKVDGQGDPIKWDSDEVPYVYNDILPGESLKKEVFVENTSKANSQWIKAEITVTGVDRLQAAGINIEQLFKVKDKWTLATQGHIVNDMYIVEYYYDEILEAGHVANLFNEVLIPSTLTQLDMDNIETFSIIISATAIQTENLGPDVDSAKEAFNVVFPAGNN